MEHLLTMQHFKRVKNWPHDLRYVLLGEVLFTLSQHLTQGFAPIQAHGHVPRAVAFPEAKHLDQRWMRELGEHLRLVDEAPETRVKHGAVIGRAHRHMHAVDTPSEGRWHEFLQRDDAI